MQRIISLKCNSAAHVVRMPNDRWTNQTTTRASCVQKKEGSGQNELFDDDGEDVEWKCERIK